MEITAGALCALLNGKLEGNAETVINRPSKIEEGEAGSISFLANSKYEHFVYTTNASVILVDYDFKPAKKINSTLIRVSDVYASVAFLLEKFGQNGSESPVGTSDTAKVHEEADLADGVFIGEFSVIGRKSKIGAGSRIMNQVYVSDDVQIGANCILHPGVRIYNGTVIGDNCVIKANAVIGSDGFGFAPQEDGTYKKVAQIGIVEIESNVSIGANTTIDRATMGRTWIGQGVKIDNLVQIAHNVEIGANTVIAAQAGIAGSTKIGDNCMIGGQVGFAGHLTIASGTKFQAQSGVATSIKTPNTALFGSPAIPYSNYIKSYSVFKKLPDVYRKMHQLEKRLNELLDK